MHLPPILPQLYGDVWKTTRAWKGNLLQQAITTSATNFHDMEYISMKCAAMGGKSQLLKVETPPK